MGIPTRIGLVVAKVTTPMQDFLLVELEGYPYALPAPDVVEILRAAAPTPLPTAPSIVLGALDIRGQLVPVLDVRRRLGLPQRELRSADCMILMRASGRLVAITVDKALRLEPVDLTKLDPTSALSPGGLRHVAGVSRSHDGLVVVFDFATFLSQSELAALDEALQAPGSPS